jgi:hypothetical protein
MTLDPTTTAAISIGVAAASEIIGMSKMKDNSVIELLFRVLRILFPKVKK